MSLSDIVQLFNMHHNIARQRIKNVLDCESIRYINATDIKFLGPSQKSLGKGTKSHHAINKEGNINICRICFKAFLDVSLEEMPNLKE